MALRPHGIIRLGYVRIALDPPDLSEARTFYREVVGLLEHEQSNGRRAYFRCWHEAYPWSLVIERSDSRGLVEVGFEVAEEADLRAIAERLAARGVRAVEWPPGTPLPGLEQSLAFEVPGGLKLRLYAATSPTPAYVTGHRSPDWVTPRQLRGTPAPLFLNHVAVTVPNPAETVEFLTAVLGFVVSERIESEDGRQLLSALLFRMSKDVGGQEIALFRGDRGRLHHIAFSKEDYNDILIDGQYLSEARVRLDPMGPTRQSYGKTFSLFFYDPFGVRLELCSGGRITEVHPEFEPVVWTERNLGKALSFYDAQVSDGFLDPCL